LILYLDTSLLVAAFTREPATPRVLTWLRQPGREDLLVSEWVRTEFSAALSMKMRMKEIDEAYRTQATLLFARAIADSKQVITEVTAHFQDASALAANHALGLRAGDALHLAIAKERGAVLCTLDQRLARAAIAVGAQAQLM
jgi:predicted nucleic acid-binding protein